MSPPGIEPATPRFTTGRLRPLGHQDRCFFVLKIFQKPVILITRGNTMYQIDYGWMYWNRLSDKICISLTNVDILYYCLQNFA